MKSLPTKQKAILFAFIGFSCFAFADICAKFLSQSYSVFQILTLENGLAAGLLLLLNNKLGGTKDVFNKQYLKINILRGFLNAAIGVTLFISLTMLPIANVYTVIFTMPFFAALFAIPVYKQIPTLPRIIAIIIGFIGVAIATHAESSFLDIKFLLPLACAAIIAVMFSVAKSLEGASLFTLGFPPYAITALLIAPLMMRDFQPMDLEGIAVLIIGTLCVTAAMIFTSHAFRLADASLVSPIVYTEMIWAILFGFLIFGDVPDVWMLSGAGVIIASGLYLAWSEREE